MDSLVKEGSICSVLIKSRIINEEDIRAALEEQQRSGCRIGEALVRLGIVAQEDIDWALSNQLNIPYVRLNKETIDQAAVELVPAALARKYDLIPIYRSGEEIAIALADPLHAEAIEAVAKQTGCRVSVSMPIIRELREMQDLFYGPPENQKTFGFSSTHFSEKILATVNKDLSGAAFLNLILHYMAGNQLFSLSFQPLGDVVVITARRDDFSRQIGRLTGEFYADLMQLIRSRGRMTDASGITADGSLEVMHDGQKRHFRAHVLKGRGGDYITLKLDEHLHFPASLEELDLAADKAGNFRALVAAGEGILLFVSASRDECCRIIDLYLDEADTEDKTVMILGEGPGRGLKRFPCIPFQKMLPGEVEAAAAAIRDHDPDILVIEDIAERRNFRIAGRMAMAGKLVVCGLSQVDVPGALEYLLHTRHGCGYPVLTYLKGIVSVKGIRLLCRQCRKQHLLPAGARGLLPEGVSSVPLFAPHGCSACGHTGFRGRRYLLEIIPFSDELAGLSASAGDSGEIMRHLRGTGYRGIPEESADLLAAGDITPEEYLTTNGSYDGKN
ncbi:MAG TPA: pilus assembly protein PilB [Geobacteraceae bacterium]|nr:pilus assembly protein PilB [Geobacteraceae bacterium]